MYIIYIYIYIPLYSHDIPIFRGKSMKYPSEVFPSNSRKIPIKSPWKITMKSHQDHKITMENPENPPFSHFSPAFFPAPHCSCRAAVAQLPVRIFLGHLDERSDSFPATQLMDSARRRGSSPWNFGGILPSGKRLHSY